MNLQGLTLETPEVVPFRLTQNLIDGCGVAGIEGAFRRTAEVTLGVLRQHRNTLARLHPVPCTHLPDAAGQ